MITPRSAYQKRMAQLTAELAELDKLQVPAWALIFKAWLVHAIKAEQYEIGLLLENGFLFSGFTQEATNENLAS